MKSSLVCCFVGLAVALLLPVPNASAQITPMRLAEKGPLRTWKSTVEELSEARLLGQTESEAILELPDGKELNVPFKKLSNYDLTHIGDLINKETWKPEDATRAPVKKRIPPTIDPRAPFDAKTVAKAWGAPDEPLKLTAVTDWTLEKAPDVFEFSKDGELIYVSFFAEAKHLLFRAKDGKLLEVFKYGTAPLTAAAISADGKFIVATLGKEGSGVYEIAEKKQRFVHTALTETTNLLVTNEKQPRVFGSRTSGRYNSYPLLGGWGGTFVEPFVLFGSTVTATDKTEMSMSADGRFLAFRVPADPRQFYISTFKEWGTLVKGSMQSSDMTGGSSIAVGNRVVAHCGVPNAVMIMKFGEDGAKSLAQQAMSFRSTPDRQVSVSPDDAYVATCSPDRGHLTVYSLGAAGGVKRYGFHQSAKPKLLRIDWQHGVVALCTAEAQVNVAQMSGHQSRLELVAADIRSWLENKQDDRIEALAAELAKDGSCFSWSPLVPKFALLEQITRAGEFLSQPEWNKLVKEWRERNPRGSLARYYQAQQLTTEAWQIRGGGFAGSITEWQWKKFNEKLAELEPVLASFDDDPVIPPPAYALIFAHAKAQQWEDARVEKYVARMLKECPDNIEAHCAQAEALMPRWGGTEDSCREYAERVAKRLGGPAGDGMYALIANRLVKYHAGTVFTELGFDSARVHRGLAHYFRDNLDSPYYHQIGLVLGGVANDRPSVEPYIRAIRERNEPPLPDVLQDELYPNLVRAFKLDRP